MSFVSMEDWKGFVFEKHLHASPSIPDIPCTIDDLGEEGCPDGYGMLELWDTAREWLSLRVVQLYDIYPQSEKWITNVWHTPLTSTPAGLPYARCISYEGMSSTTFFSWTRLACGEDAEGRDIMLKLVDNDSYQHRIFHTLLQQQSLFTDPRTFPGVLPPITIIDTPHKYCIVTMPKWGDTLYITDMQDVRQVLTFMRCLLEGLSFLHANRIAHRDIGEMNIVVNCYRLDNDMDKFRDDLREHRRTPDVVYAFMDYDQSIHLPSHVSVKDCRRPADEAWRGWGLYKLDDVCHGQRSYNPFAYDVGMLGYLFRANLAGAVPMVPALPALFDAMTTHVVSRRFSAQEALNFFRENIELPSKDVLGTLVTLGVNYEAIEDPEVYWSKLTPPVQAHWSQFRTAPLPRSWHILNWLMDIPACCRIIVFARRIFRI